MTTGEQTIASSSSSDSGLPPPRPRRWRRRLTLSLATLVILVADIVLGATLLIRAAIPQTSGTIQVAGVNAPITVTRDAYGVPHIDASDQHDLFFAQGYVTAQDRLFQMEFNRRVAAGRLSEIFGASVVPTDEFLRTLGLTRTAQADVDALPSDLHAELDAYTQGVNAYISTHMNSLPLEFRVLGFTPEPWHDTDSIAYGKVVALDLDGSWSIKLARAMVLAQVGPTLTAQLFPGYPADNPTLIDATGDTALPLGSEAPAPTPSASTAALLRNLPANEAADLATLTHATLGPGVAQLQSLLGRTGGVLGSNDWVIAGSHTTTGMPILANDPHLGIQYPAIWYEIGLHDDNPADHYNAIGFAFPGVPGIIIGHNDHIAWGVTDGMVDDTDMYIEHLSADKTEYLHGGVMVPLQTREEVIHVKGGADQHITVRVTNHGPILNDVLGKDFKSAAPMALQWTALQPGYTFGGFFMLGAARNWSEFEDALRNISISQNFVYADTQGNIGYRLSGWLPIRPQLNGLVPVESANGAFDWTGRVPFDAMPHLFNPPTGIILTANNRITSPDYPYFITNDWDIGYRAKRIEQLLMAKPQFSPADVAQVQLDVTSIPAQQIAPLYLSAANGDNSAGARAAQTLLTGWDGSMPRSSAAATFYEVTTTHLLQDFLHPVLNKTSYSQWDQNVYAIDKFLIVRNLLDTPQAPFCPSAADCVTAVRHAEDEAASDLTKTYGTSDPTRWLWGKLHHATFASQLASVPPLNLIFPDQTIQRPGDSSTINVGGAGNFADGDYSQDTVPSMREIIDMSNLDNSKYVTTTGESGLPFAPHNFDLLPLWDQGQYQPMTFSSAAVKAAAVNVLTLTP